MSMPLWGERDRVVVVVTVDEMDVLDADLTHAPERPALLVGWLSPHEVTPVANERQHALGGQVRARHATVVVLSRQAQNEEDVVVQATSLHESGVRIRTLSMFYEQWLGKIPLNELERVSLLFDIGEVHAVSYARVKRMLDTVLASCGLVALVLVTPFVLLGNMIVNRGPLFYRQPRVGRNGTEFDILKFRTMRASTRDSATDWTAADDVRITPFGGLLRRSHLDELPQVINILRGELATVGPRPEQPQRWWRSSSERSPTTDCVTSCDRA